MPSTAVTAPLVELAAHLPTSAIPADAWEMGRLTVGNAASLAVGASRHPAVALALDAVRAFGERPVASVLGRPERMGAASAAMVNGIAVHVEDFDDTHLESLVHPAAPVVPSALAAAELAGASGRDVVAGVVIGMEVAIRTALHLGRAHADRGWHVTGTAGHLGAAAAAGRVVGLDGGEMAAALALAATEAAGLILAAGTMTKSLHPGKAAADGIEAALLARAGINGPPAPLEALAPLLSDATGSDAAVAGLGTTWHAVANAFKPYACGVVAHPVIDAAIALRAELAEGETLERAEVAVNPLVLEAMGRADPADSLDGKFSVHHCFAVGLLLGAAGPAQFADAVVRDPAVADVRRRLRFVVDDTVAMDETRVEAVTSSDRAVHHHVRHASGSVDSPLRAPALRAKALLLTEPVLGPRAPALVDLAFALDAAPGVAPLFEAARG